MVTTLEFDHRGGSGVVLCSYDCKQKVAGVAKIPWSDQVYERVGKESTGECDVTEMWKRNSEYCT